MDVDHMPSEYANVTPHQFLINITNQFTNVCNTLTSLTTTGKNLQQELKQIHKNYRDEHIRLTKVVKKKRITKMHLPVKVSPELRNFLHLSKGELISRKKVMGNISSYVKMNNLQLTENKRFFSPDDALLKLFNLKEAKAMRFIEINKYISHHFPKPASTSS